MPPEIEEALNKVKELRNMAAVKLGNDELEEWFFQQITNKLDLCEKWLLTENRQNYLIQDLLKNLEKILQT